MRKGAGDASLLHLVSSRAAWEEVTSGIVPLSVLPWILTSCPSLQFQHCLDMLLVEEMVKEESERAAQDESFPQGADPSAAIPRLLKVSLCEGSISPSRKLP